MCGPGIRTRVAADLHERCRVCVGAAAVEVGDRLRVPVELDRRAASARGGEELGARRVALLLGAHEDDGSREAEALLAAAGIQVGPHACGTSELHSRCVVTCDPHGAAGVNNSTWVHTCPILVWIVAAQVDGLSVAVADASFLQVVVPAHERRVVIRGGLDEERDGDAAITVEPHVPVPHTVHTESAVHRGKVHGVGSALCVALSRTG